MASVVAEVDATANAAVVAVQIVTVGVTANAVVQNVVDVPHAKVGVTLGATLAAMASAPDALMAAQTCAVKVA